MPKTSLHRYLTPDPAGEVTGPWGPAVQTPPATDRPTVRSSLPLAFTASAVVGVIGGMIGLGGAEFRLPLLIMLFGFAGGELLIPTIVLLFDTDIEIAGSLSLAVSLPTMLVAFARPGGSFTVLHRHTRLAGVLALGSVTGTILGGLLLGVVPEAVLVPGLAALLVLSSIKVWRHATAD